MSEQQNKVTYKNLNDLILDLDNENQESKKYLIENKDYYFTNRLTQFEHIEPLIKHKILLSSDLSKDSLYSKLLNKRYSLNYIHNIIKKIILDDISYYNDFFDIISDDYVLYYDDIVKLHNNKITDQKLASYIYKHVRNLCYESNVGFNVAKLIYLYSNCCKTNEMFEVICKILPGSKKMNYFENDKCIKQLLKMYTDDVIEFDPFCILIRQFIGTIPKFNSEDYFTLYQSLGKKLTEQFFDHVGFKSLCECKCNEYEIVKS